METKTKKLVYLTLVSLTLLVLAVIVFLSYKNNVVKSSVDSKDIHTNNQIDSNNAKDIFKAALENNQKLKESNDALVAKDYQKAINLAQEVINTTSDVGEKSMAEFNIGDSYIGLKNIPDGTNRLYSIYSNNEYAKTTRAAALNTIIQQYNGTKNKEFLKVVIEDPYVLNDNQIKDIVYEKIYELYPLGIASAYIGTKRLSNVAQVDRGPAEEKYKQFISEIDEDIEFQSQGVGSAHIVPNIMLAKARFMIFAYTKFKLSSVGEISAVYEKAANLSRANNYKITEQFVYLNYINFLAIEKETIKAEQVIQIFMSEPPQEMVLQNLKQEPLSKNWPGLASLVKNSSNLRSYFELYKIKY